MLPAGNSLNGENTAIAVLFMKTSHQKIALQFLGAVEFNIGACNYTVIKVIMMIWLTSNI